MNRDNKSHLPQQFVFVINTQLKKWQYQRLRNMLDVYD